MFRETAIWADCVTYLSREIYGRCCAVLYVDVLRKAPFHGCAPASTHTVVVDVFPSQVETLSFLNSLCSWHCNLSLHAPHRSYSHPYVCFAVLSCAFRVYKFFFRRLWNMRGLVIFCETLRIKEWNKIGYHGMVLILLDTKSKHQQKHALRLPGIPTRLRLCSFYVQICKKRIFKRALGFGNGAMVRPAKPNCSRR